MLRENLAKAKSGFRTLDTAELSAVSGGADIFVDGTPTAGGLDIMGQLALGRMQQHEAILFNIAMFEGTTQEAPDDLDDGSIKLLDKLPAPPVDLDDR